MANNEDNTVSVFHETEPSVPQCEPLPVTEIRESSSVGNYVPANALDGNLDTRWQPEGVPAGILLDLGKPSRPGMRDGEPEDADDSSDSPRRQNSDSPMDDNLALLVEVFKTMFRGLCDADGRVSHYDLVTKLINSQKFGRGLPPSNAAHSTDGCQICLLTDTHCIISGSMSM